MALAGPAAAQSPVAVVEDVQGKVTGAEFMDYVTPKTVIKIAAGGSVVISYMKSCQREKISGLGTVIIGTDESFVQFADVKREKTDCDSAQSHATTKATSEAAATVLRSLADDKNAAAKIKPQLTIYGTSPVVEAKGKGTLVVERLDIKGERSRSSSTAARPRASSMILPAPTVRWRPAAPMRRRSAPPRSCSGSIRRPSPARRRSSAA